MVVSTRRNASSTSSMDRPVDRWRRCGTLDGGWWPGGLSVRSSCSSGRFTIGRGEPHSAHRRQVLPRIRRLRCGTEGEWCLREPAAMRPRWCLDGRWLWPVVRRGAVHSPRPTRLLPDGVARRWRDSRWRRGATGHGAAHIVREAERDTVALAPAQPVAGDDPVAQRAAGRALQGQSRAQLVAVHRAGGAGTPRAGYEAGLPSTLPRHPW